ncbi:MAG: 6-phosphogluconolactonase [Gemmatimonadota bacterium]
MTPRSIIVLPLAALHEAVAEAFAAAAAAAVSARGRFLAVLTGGSTVPPIYARLAAAPLASSIPWEKTHLFWSDERCVPPDHPDSNYDQARGALLDHVPVPPAHVHRLPGEDPNRERAAAAYKAVVREVTGSTNDAAGALFDFVLLGVGADAHVGSLFPQAPTVHVTNRLVTAVRLTDVAIPPPSIDRLTLTAPALNAGRETAVVATGSKKAPAVRDVLQRPRDLGRWPAQVIAPVEGTLTWFLDPAAAEELAPRDAGD